MYTIKDILEDISSVDKEASDCLEDYLESLDDIDGLYLPAE